MALWFAERIEENKPGLQIKVCVVFILINTFREFYNLRNVDASRWFEEVLAT